MKKTLAVVACSLLLAIAVPASSSESETDPVAEYIALRGVDPATLEPIALAEVDLAEFLAALGPLAVPTGSVVGNDAGCDNPTGFFFGWATTGVPTGNCPGGFFGWPITWGVWDCEIFCFSDAWGNTLFYAICQPGSHVLADFTSGTTVTVAGQCTFSGTPPTSAWDSLGYGGKWAYADNAFDAILHL